MANQLPYSRVVNVNLTREDAFPARRGFGTLLILSNVAVAGILDATHRTRVYSTIEEVAVNHNSTTSVYKAALAAFSQNPRPSQIKIGFITFNVGTDDADDLVGQLNAIYDADSDWYWLGIVKELRDLPALDGLVDWTQAKSKQAMLDSNDDGHEDPADTTNISARHKGTVDRTSTFYHSDVAEHGAIALAAALSTFNFDDAASAYTAKFKRLNSVASLDKPSAVTQAVTGFTPQLGQSLVAGHMANTVVNIGGRLFVTEGSTLTPNVFIDEVHATDWIVARTEEETLSVLLNNNRIPFTDVGLETLTSGVRTVMALANRAGLIANDEVDDTGAFIPAVEITVPRATDVPASQRKARIAPAISVRFRYAGAVHYTTINYRMAF